MEPSSTPRSERPRSRARRETDADYLKERVYATFTGLAIALVLAGNAAHHDARDALFTLVIGVVGITAAGYVSDFIAHLATARAFPSREQNGEFLRVAAGALGTVVVPAILLALAWAEVLSLTGALRATVIIYLVTLAAIGYLAVRRAKLAWWQQVVAMALLVVLGATVIGLQTLAHSA
ncbi:hypothetical protein [Glaciibacter flavus]|uniref:hypothetical protein n=1 Tax=Orlajensenia flava TaxID=2565934 RepID=UPI003AFFF935